MENNSSKESGISKILIYFGTIVFIISFIDLCDLLIPLRLSNTEWVFGVTQQLISSVLVPALSIVLVLTGIYFGKISSLTKKVVNFERFVGFISFALGLALICHLLVYSLSLNAYQVSVISSIKAQQTAALEKIEQTKDKLAQIKSSKKYNISEIQYKNKLIELNKAAIEVNKEVTQQIKITKNKLLRQNIKSIIELLLYIGLYILIGQAAYKSSRNDLLKLKFDK